ncbi:MAG: phenylalanine--tRNA ligase subunit beta [Rhodospirillales bacterium]|jgi:phenylalanyl-tRNA synthetase beta chain|nr:phenylalanine--tRNA ligase subunit beta [Rhodospirillales bacterium]
MKFTLGWLKEHLDTDATVGAIAETLSMIGLEVEEVTDRAEGLSGFTAARVIEAKPHPNADRLKVCRVETAAGEVEVVCGAPNAVTGMKAVFAPAGSYLPGPGHTFDKAEIRGVVSNGMLLSEREMGLGEDHDGIVELAADTPVGAAAAQVMGLDDPIIDIAITPNRGDCLGVRGIARDLAAAGMGTLRPLNAEAVPGAFTSPIAVHLDFDKETLDACPYFVGRTLRGVVNGDSPDWLKERLEAIGLRPISALVDITNLLTIGLNRPLHVFDADKVEGDLHLRLARPGETLMALNEKEYTLDGDMTVIADEGGAEALGGVMGGMRTGCTGDTVNVFIEAAYFDPLRTAATGRKLDLQSDARYRFERGIDPAFLIDGMEIATRLALDLCGGEASELVIAGAEPEGSRDITLRVDRVMALGGVELAAGEIERILTTLGFGVAGEGLVLRVSVPSWRSDIVGEACLVEEVVRIYGYDRVPAVPMAQDHPLPAPALTKEQQRRSRARRVLAGRGLVEAVTVSFMAGAQAGLFGGVPETTRLVNPISSDLDVMRPCLLPNLIAAAGRNADRGLADAALFEIGPQYAGDAPPDQAMVAAAARSGCWEPRNWSAPARPVDAFDAKADALAVLAALGVPIDKLQVDPEAPGWYHPGRSGRLKLGPKTVLAHFGEVHPRVLRRMGVKGPVAGVEIFLDALPPAKARKSAARPALDMSPLHPVERDFAFVVDEGVAAGAVLGAARGAEPKLIIDVGLFDVFSGGALEAGRKSLAITVTLQPREKTLTDAEIEAVSNKVVAAVEKATGGTLRA